MLSLVENEHSTKNNQKIFYWPSGYPVVKCNIDVFSSETIGEKMLCSETLSISIKYD